MVNNGLSLWNGTWQFNMVICSFPDILYLNRHTHLRYILNHDNLPIVAYTHVRRVYMCTCKHCGTRSFRSPQVQIGRCCYCRTPASDRGEGVVSASIYNAQLYKGTGIYRTAFTSFRRQSMSVRSVGVCKAVLLILIYGGYNTT